MKLPTDFKERRKELGSVLGFFFFVFFKKPFGEFCVLQSAYPKWCDSSFPITMRKQQLFVSPSNHFVLFVWTGGLFICQT